MRFNLPLIQIDPTTFGQVSTSAHSGKDSLPHSKSRSHRRITRPAIGPGDLAKMPNQCIESWQFLAAKALNPSHSSKSSKNWSLHCGSFWNQPHKCAGLRPHRTSASAVVLGYQGLAGCHGATHVKPCLYDTSTISRFHSLGSSPVKWLAACGCEKNGWFLKIGDTGDTLTCR